MTKTELEKLFKLYEPLTVKQAEEMLKEFHAKHPQIIAAYERLSGTLVECTTCHYSKLDAEGDSICHNPAVKKSYPEGMPRHTAIILFCKDFKLWRKK